VHRRNVKAHGFTMIEMICVIVVLGFLAATAMPRFVNLKKEANISAVKGLERGVKSADAMFTSWAIVKGVNKRILYTYPSGVGPAKRPGQVSLWCGHPNTVAEGIGNALHGANMQQTGEEGDAFLFDQGAFMLVYEWTQVRWRLKSAMDPDRCFVKYDYNPGACDGTSPVITSEISGC
jgi:prepilin-type N-terminal cleavage/methylation domain-containing protein